MLTKIKAIIVQMPVPVFSNFKLSNQIETVLVFGHVTIYRPGGSIWLSRGPHRELSPA